MKTAVGQTSAECLPQAPGRSGWHGHFSDCSLCCSLLLAASTLCISLSGMTLFTWLFSEAAFSDVAMLVLSAALFTFGYMGLLAFLFKFNGSKLDAYILEDIDRSYRRIEETNEKGGKQ